MTKENSFELFKGFVEASGHLPFPAKDFKEMYNLYHWYIRNRKTYEPLKNYLKKHKIPTYKQFLKDEDNKLIFEAIKKFVIENNYLPSNDDYFEVLENTHHTYDIEAWINDNRYKYKPFKEFLKEYKNTHELLSNKAGKTKENFKFYEEKLNYFIKTYKKLPEYGGYINLGVVDEYDLAKFLDFNRNKLTHILADNDEIVKNFLISRQERLKQKEEIIKKEAEEERKRTLEKKREKKKKSNIYSPVAHKPDLPKFNITSVLKNVNIEHAPMIQPINLNSEINKEIITTRPDLALFLERENKLRQQHKRLSYVPCTKELTINLKDKVIDEEGISVDIEIIKSENSSNQFLSLDELIAQEPISDIVFDSNLHKLIFDISSYYEVEIITNSKNIVEFNLNHNLSGLKNLNIKIDLKNKVLFFNDLTNHTAFIDAFRKKNSLISDFLSKLVNFINEPEKNNIDEER